MINSAVPERFGRLGSARVVRLDEQVTATA
jgi:hypothetical protein